MAEVKQSDLISLGVNPEVVAADEQFYVLLTGTTAASTDIQLAGITLTVQEG